MVAHIRYIHTSQTLCFACLSALLACLPLAFVPPANGLGMVLAEKGTLDHAKDVFARVREVSAEVLGDVWVNLAHVYLAQNKHNEVNCVAVCCSRESCQMRALDNVGWRGLPQERKVGE